MKIIKHLLFAALLTCIGIFPVLGSGNSESKSSSEEEVISLSVWSHLSNAERANYKSRNDHPVFKKLEEVTGVHINWVHPPSGAGEEGFNLMVASRDYEDIIVTGWTGSPGSISSYVDDGVIIELTDLLPEYAPNFWNVASTYENTLHEYLGPEKKAYYIPILNTFEEGKPTPGINVYFGPQLRKDWLEKLNMKVPETRQEFWDVCHAFKTRDPNGNGVADEIPISGTQFISGTKGGDWYGIGKMITWSFGMSYDVYQVDGVVKYGTYEDRFYEVLQWAKAMWDADFIDPDYLLNDRERMDNKVRKGIVGIIHSYQPSRFMREMPKVNPEFEIAGIPYIKDDDGNNYCFEGSYLQTVIGGGSAAVSTACEHVEEAVGWLDYPFTEEGRLLFNFGIEGKSWNYVNETPTLNDTIWNNPDGHDSSTAIKLYTMQGNAWPMWYHPDFSYSKEKGVPYKCMEAWSTGDLSRVFPPYITLTDDERTKRSQINSELEPYLSEMINKFIIGQVPLNEETFRDFQSKQKKVKVEELISIYQTAYDRFMKNR